MKGHIRKRGKNSWQLKYESGTDPGTGKRKTEFRTFRGGKREAKDELIRLMDTVRCGEHIDASKLTVNQFLDKWEAGWVATQVSPRTGEGYMDKLRVHVRPHIGAIPLSKLQPSNLTGLYGQLINRPLAARTVGHVHRALHKALVVAVQWNLLARNPADLVDPPRVEVREIEILTSEQVQTILRRLRGRAIYPIIVMAMTTGMRRGEILALRWRDIDDKATVIRVERSIEQTKKGGLRIKPPKTKYGRRAIKVPASVMAELKAHWTDQQEQRMKLGFGRAGDDDLVFPTWDGKLRSPNATTREWYRARDALKLPKVTLHAFRHTHASQIIAEGMDPVAVSRRLGHGSVVITLGLYGHLFENKADRAADIIEAAYGKALAGSD